MQWCSDGLSAMAVYNMIYLLFISFPLGMSAVIRMLTSVFVGEEDRDSILDLVRITLTSVLAVTLAIGAAVFIMSDDLAALYFPDLSSDVFELTRQLLAVFAVSIPLVLVTSCTSDFFQAVGHIAFVNVISISDGFLAMVIPTLFLAPLLGARGVWIALFVGSVAVALLEAFYSALRCRSFRGHLPRKLDEWLLLPLVFREDDNPRMTFTLREMEDISRVAEEAEQFCKKMAQTAEPLITQASAWRRWRGISYSTGSETTHSMEPEAGRQAVLRLRVPPELQNGKPARLLHSTPAGVPDSIPPGPFTRIEPKGC